MELIHPAPLAEVCLPCGLRVGAEGRGFPGVTGPGPPAPPLTSTAAPPRRSPWTRPRAAQVKLAQVLLCLPKRPPLSRSSVLSTSEPPHLG